MIEGIGSSGFSQGMSALWGGMSKPDPARMARELFASTDADGSGSIDQEELSAALSGKSGDGKGPDAAELFSALDADGDGLITEEEHEAGLAAMHKDLAQASMLTSVSLSGEMSSLADELFASIPEPRFTWTVDEDDAARPVDDHPGLVTELLGEP